MVEEKHIQDVRTCQNIGNESPLNLKMSSQITLAYHLCLQSGGVSKYIGRIPEQGFALSGK